MWYNKFMRRKSDSIIRLSMIIGDALMLILAFAAAYFFRVYIDPRPFVFTAQIPEFVRTVVLLVPVMIVILAALGLYKKSIFLGKSRLAETLRLMLAAVLSTASLIVYDFFAGGNVFPVRVMAVMSVLIAFLGLLFERSLIRAIAKWSFRQEFGVKRVVIIGNNKNTEYLADYISSTPESEYVVAGIVAGKRFIPKKLRRKQYSSLKEALKRARADVVFQTDEKSTEYVFRQTVERHILYYFVPSEAALSSNFGELELIGNTPAMLVKLTPLSGGAVAFKRGFDIVFSIIAIILAAIPMAIVWAILKATDPKHSAIYADERLTQYNRKFKCYKFRSMKPEYSGMTAEAAFTKMGREELIRPYRKNGDKIKNDPRITKFGAFIRKTSIDELPQLFNILKGDISLIGPRALLPGELRRYGDRSLILTVKSGLTGLAQVSGRRDISFEERRALDIYYVKNWSIGMDATIFFRTIGVVLKGDGAK